MYTLSCSKIICKSLAQNTVILRQMRKLQDSYATHYDILGLSRNCSRKDIKNAFIKLSKIHHPDKSRETGSQERFVQVLKAYNVLSKPESRRDYDYALEEVSSLRARYREHQFYQHVHTEANKRKGYGYEDSTFWANNRAKTEYEERPFYGIHGLNRVSNGTIAFLCIMLASFAAVLQFYAIRHSITLKRDELIKRSEENQAILEQVQNEAKKNGPELQIRLIEQRLLTNRFYTGSNKD